MQRRSANGPWPRLMRWGVRWGSFVVAGVLLQAAGCVQDPELVGFQIANLLRTAFVRALGFALINR